MINQERLQIKVNKSIGIICEDYHTSFTTLLLYGLAIFVFGYIIAKWDKWITKYITQKNYDIFIYYLIRYYM